VQKTCPACARPLVGPPPSPPRCVCGASLEPRDLAEFLDDVDLHNDGEGGRSKDDWVRRAARFGVWKKHDHLLIPKERVVSIRRLGEIA